MFVTPLFGMWLSSSLAAYHNRSIYMCIGFGLLLFPVLPLAWDRFSLWRDRKKHPGRKRFLTGVDRLVLRTLALNFVFIGSIMWIAPASAFRAISTRGDWMLDGFDGPFSTGARKILFTLADTLEGASSEHNGEYGKSDKGPGDSSSNEDQDFGERVAQKLRENIPPRLATEHWPLADKVHTAVREMPTSAQDSYQSVAQYIARRFDDPFERTRAIHDYVVLRLAYDDDYIAQKDAGENPDRPSQQAKDVFSSRIAVCEGYARLMAKMGQEAGLELAYLVGKARFQMRESDGSGHAWNAVRIDGQWYLIDATWNDSKRGYRTTYLFTPPALFGVDHFPDDPKWQLRETPLSIGEFMRQPDLRPDFALHDLQMLSPRRSQVTVSDSLKLKIGNPRDVFMMASFAPKTGGTDKKCQVAPGDPTEITCQFARDGEFVVTLYASKKQQGTYEGVARQLVNRR